MECAWSFIKRPAGADPASSGNKLIIFILTKNSICRSSSFRGGLEFRVPAFQLATGFERAASAVLDAHTRKRGFSPWTELPQVSLLFPLLKSGFF
jgi:hypothetical protein